MADFYWVGDSGNWDDSAHWASSSGGAGGAGVPTNADNVFIDVNSFTLSGQAITIRQGHNAFCLNFDTSGVLYAPDLHWYGGSILGAGALLEIWGTLFLFAGMTSSFSAAGASQHDTFLRFRNSAPITVNTTGVNIPVLIDVFGNDIQLASNFSCLIFVCVNLTRTIDTGDYDLTAAFFDFKRATINAYASIFTCTGFLDPVTGFFFGGFLIEDAASVFNDGGSIIKFTYTPNPANNGTPYDLQLFGQIVGEVQFLGTTSPTDFYYLADANFGPPGSNITTVSFQPGANIIISSASVFHIGTLNMNGAAGNNVILRSDATGFQYTIDATIVSVSFVDVEDCIAAGSIPFVDAGGVDAGNNVNWSFTPGGPIPEAVTSSDITFDAANIQGNIPDLTGIDEIGLVWDTAPAPVITDSHVEVFGIIGPFFVDITGLIPGQTYYVRTYIKKGAVYSYGTVTLTFTVPSLSPTLFPVTDNLIGPYQIEILDGSDNVLANLTGLASNLEFAIMRNRPEEIGFSIPLTSFETLCQELHSDPKDVFATGIVTVRIKRKSTIILAGQLDYWEADFSDPANPVLRVKAHGWLSLLSYRLFSGEYVSQDANFIIQDIISQTQALTNGDFGITIGSTAAGTNSYADKKFENKNISDALIEFSEEANGLDFNFTWDKVLNLYWPTIGQQRNNFLFTYPGNILSLNVSSDSTKIVNSLLARGKGNADANISTIINDLVSQGTYKLRTAVKDFPDIDADQLVNLASSEVAYYKDDLKLYNLTYSGANPACPEIGTFGIGDQVRILIGKFQLFSNISTFFTIDKITVKLNDNGVEIVELAFNNAP